ncbi:transcription factor TGA2.2-like isoform X2 [Phoenix dactylifera]|uniref:Transcription factor TGA2.2-like isoform X2 n=1 Tax=Phoenix dactylifera TaxID=42345 RepID=A0A8B7CKC3_PHODC|nr:transcription factor TGA2.2-like isoform X2 [Phoenix dactylifera]
MHLVINWIAFSEEIFVTIYRANIFFKLTVHFQVCRRTIYSVLVIPISNSSRAGSFCMSPNSMSSASAQFATSRRIGASTIVEADAKHDNRLGDIPLESPGPSKKYDQEANKPADKVLRRLAQNREAARKSRLRKKAYVQQLESSRLKLSQLEQELEHAKQQGVYVGGHLGDSSLGLSGTVNSGVAAFEMEYGHWVEEQNRQTGELRAALQAHVSDIELRMLVESGMSHYDNLFHIKAIAAKSDVFYLMSGMWKTPAERFFLWIGGFRPSELLKVLSPQLEPLTEQQVVAVCNLQQSSQQAEDALSQGMDKLQQTLAETLTSDPLGASGVATYMGQMANAMGKLEGLVNFVNQADHLRQQTLQQMYKILTTRQAARGLLVLGDYFQRLRALSSLWTARPHEPA